MASLNTSAAERPNGPLVLDGRRLHVMPARANNGARIVELFRSGMAVEQTKREVGRESPVTFGSAEST
jgi:hypothetical protein